MPYRLIEKIDNIRVDLIIARESNYNYSADAAITITWDQLAERIMEIEDYLIAYPGETIRKWQVAEFFINYLYSYLYGQDNTPSYDWQTKVVLDDVIESYKKMEQSYPGTETGMIICEYIHFIHHHQLIFIKSG